MCILNMLIMFEQVIWFVKKHKLEPLFTIVKSVTGKLNKHNRSKKIGEASLNKEGVIVKNKKTGKFFIACYNKAKSDNLTRGNQLEIYYNNEWHAGKVEVIDGEFYFYGEVKTFLYTGLRARQKNIY